MGNMAFKDQAELINPENNIHQSVDQRQKRQYAQTICFILIVIMNMSAWIDLSGLSVEVPLIIPVTPEGWTLPSTLSICLCAANIMPAMIIVLRRYQGKRFSEIPYIYTIIIVGAFSCFALAFFWQKTIFLFGRERSVWLIGFVFTLSTLDCTSSLVFYDYMKRFRARYLTAVFLGEALTGIIPLLLLLMQGVGGEAICILNNNGTFLKPTFTQPRFSVTIFMLIISGIIVISLIAFILLRWTNIISLADAAEPMQLKETIYETICDADENIPAIPMMEPSVPTIQVVTKPFILLLFLNAFNSFMVIGLVSPVITYSLLPYGQKTLYYATLLGPLAYPIALIFSIRWSTISIPKTIVGSLFGWTSAVFIIIIAAQSPCPWWADSSHGAVIMLVTQFSSSLVMVYLRITIGNYIKTNWSNDKGMFYFGISFQLGSLVGTIPMYLLVSVFDVFTARKPCETYCVA